MRFSEEKILAEIKKIERVDREIERGIGDDGAVLWLKEGRYVFSQDMLIEGVHFERSYMDFEDIGKKSLYVNISDILAMGAEPLYFLFSLAIPKDLSFTDLKGLFKGISAVSEEFNLFLLGGNLSFSPKGLIIDVSIFGRLLTKDYLGRDKAKSGDVIAVTGFLGESSFGLYLLKKKKRGEERYIKRFKNPRPPYELWKELIKHDIPNAMIDISDGLLLDLERLLKESKKGANLYFEKIPIPEILFKERKEMLALTGGEDYEFLFTFSREKAYLLEDLKKRGFSFYVIGEITEQKGLRVYKDGRLMKIKRKGYDHFLNHG